MEKLPINQTMVGFHFNGNKGYNNETASALFARVDA